LSHKYGVATVKNSAAIPEAEVLFSKSPTATSLNPEYGKNITNHRVQLSGATSVAGYVYCWVEKSGEERVRVQTNPDGTPVEVKAEPTTTIVNGTNTTTKDAGFVATKSLVEE
jgi:hypothetical protein